MPVSDSATWITKPFCVIGLGGLWLTPSNNSKFPESAKYKWRRCHLERPRIGWEGKWTAMQAKTDSSSLCWITSCCNRRNALARSSWRGILTSNMPSRQYDWSLTLLDAQLIFSLADIHLNGSRSERHTRSIPGIQLIGLAALLFSPMNL